MFIKKNINITIKNIKNLININKIIDYNNNIKKKIKIINNNKKKIFYKKKINKYNKIIFIYKKILLIYNDIKLLYFFYKKNNYEINIYINKIKKLIYKLNKYIFKKKYNYNAIIKIYSKLGGKDSNNWVKILENMYIMWANNNNYSYTIINKNFNNKKTLIKIKGKYIFGYLYGENGIHKLIRISPFNKKKKRQTSLAYVSVYPLKIKKKIEINYKDLIFNTFRSSGSGGQNVNKVETGIRVKHIPTNIVVEYTKTRSQLQNKNNAIKILKYKLFKKIIKKKKIKKKNYIRNYIMNPYKLIKDLKTGYKTNNFNKIINGNLNEIIYKFINKKFLFK
ncbi:MAG: PCRF domain-containing protein [Candidatus Shikimatogenerans bostrichidophilus]|nr:MAG: PCRF domain-containing protein [Candidatus Shikimatogenerans bostrichidophilus]